MPILTIKSYTLDVVSPFIYLCSPTADSGSLISEGELQRLQPTWAGKKLKQILHEMLSPHRVHFVDGQGFQNNAILGKKRDSLDVYPTQATRTEVVQDMYAEWRMAGFLRISCMESN